MRNYLIKKILIILTIILFNKSYLNLSNDLNFLKNYKINLV